MGTFDFFFKKLGSDFRNSGHLDINSDNNTFEEYSAELYDEKTYHQPLESVINSYSEKGITLEKVPATIKITYSGILSRQNTSDLYAVIGYGNNLKWEDVETLRMQKNPDQNFELLFHVKREGNINVAFKDSADNWDNNSGMNYVFDNSFLGRLH